jgi:hypothetical protein
MHLTYRVEDGSWLISATGSNLTNKLYYNSVFDLRPVGAGADFALLAPPREYSIQVDRRAEIQRLEQGRIAFVHEFKPGDARALRQSRDGRRGTGRESQSGCPYSKNARHGFQESPAKCHEAIAPGCCAEPILSQ